MVREYIFIIALMTPAFTANCLVCDDPVETNTGRCTNLLAYLEKALLQDEGNLFRLRQAFFHSPTADPVLLKVVYNITYAQNITIALDGNEIQPCSTSSTNSSIELQQQNITLGWTSTGVYVVFHPTVLNMMQTQLPFSILRIVHAIMYHSQHQRSSEADTFLWDGLYDLPTLHLNMHIASLPCIPSQDLFMSVLMDFNTMLKVYTEQQEVRNFENNIGFTTPNQMVLATINLKGLDVIITNLYSFIMCFLYAASVYSFLNHFYPSHEKKISTYIRNNKELVGGLTITASVTVAIEILTRFINSAIWSASIDNGSGVLIAVWLPQGCIFFMGTCLNIHYHIKYYRKKTPGPVGDSEENTKHTEPAGDSERTTKLIGPVGDFKGTIKLTEPVGDSEGTTKLTGPVGDSEGTIKLTEPVGDSEGTTKLTEPVGDSEEITKHTEPIGDSEEITKLTELVVDSKETTELIGLINDSEGSTETRECLNFFRQHYDSVITKFSANINVHIILPLMLIAYGIVYTAFPAFVLMVAYPTQVISIIPTAVAFLFATVIFSAIMIKLYMRIVPSPRLEKRKETIMFIVCRFIPFYFAVLFLKSVMVIFLYLLIIGRGSVTTGPLLTILLSILPPLSVSGVSWIAKKMILDKEKKITPSSESGNQLSTTEGQLPNQNSCQNHIQYS